VISRTNQVTLPVDAMRDAGLATGDDVRIRSAGPGRIEVVKTDDLVDELAGIFDEHGLPAGLRRGDPRRLAVVRQGRRDARAFRHPRRSLWTRHRLNEPLQCGRRRSSSVSMRLGSPQPRAALPLDLAAQPAAVQEPALEQQETPPPAPGRR